MGLQVFFVKQRQTQLIVSLDTFSLPFKGQLRLGENKCHIQFERLTLFQCNFGCIDSGEWTAQELKTKHLVFQVGTLFHAGSLSDLTLSADTYTDAP